MPNTVLPCRRERIERAVHLAALFGALLLPSSAKPDGSGRPLWDPPAIDVFPQHGAAVRGERPLADFLADGRRLFLAQFNVLDGAGRPMATGDSKPTIRSVGQSMFQRIGGPDANSCAGCHNQPFIGGSGDFATNVFVGAHFTDPVTESISANVTNERSTTGIFGSGAIEMLAREMTADLHDIRAQARISASAQRTDVHVDLATKGVDFGTLVVHPDGGVDVDGVRGVDSDLVVKPFGVKGVAVSIREFTIFALNQHHGMQAVERFGWPRTGTADFDGDGVQDEMTVGQISALTAFQAALPAPGRVASRKPEAEGTARLGETRFAEVGCGGCHRPRLPLRSLWFFEPNPYNRPGSVVPSDVGGQFAVPLTFVKGSGLYRDANGAPYVAAFTDLKRHVICDEDDLFFCNERLRQDFVPTNQFLTAKLWDAGSSAPYGHRGDLTTLSEAIIHHSGEAKAVKQAFLDMPDIDKVAIVTFLRSLQVNKDFSEQPGWR